MAHSNRVESSTGIVEPPCSTYLHHIAYFRNVDWIPSQYVYQFVAKKALDHVFTEHPIQRATVPSSLLSHCDLQYPWLGDLWIMDSTTQEERKRKLCYAAKTGKSRMLHELSFTYQNDPATIAITTSFPPESKNFPPLLGGDETVETILAIVARVTSEVTNTDYLQIRQVLHKCIGTSAAASNVHIGSLRFNVLFAEILFRTLITAVKSFATTGNCNQNVVLLIDDMHNCTSSFSSDNDYIDHISYHCCSVYASQLVQEPRRFASVDVKKVLDVWIPIRIPSWSNIRTTNPVLAHRVLALLSCVSHSPLTTQAMIEQLAPHEHNPDFFCNADNIAQLIRQPAVISDKDMIEGLQGDDIGWTSRVSDYFDMALRNGGMQLAPIARLYRYIAEEIASSNCDTTMVWRFPVREMANLRQQLILRHADISTKYVDEIFPFRFGRYEYKIATRATENPVDNWTAPLPNSMDNVEEFLQHANHIVLADDKTVQEISLHPNEAACGMWLIRDSSHRVSTSFVLIVDTTTSERRIANRPQQARNSIMGSNEFETRANKMVARYWSTGVGEVAERMASSWTTDSLADALANRPVVFVTVNPDKTDHLMGSAANTETNMDCLQRLMGPFFHTVSAIRNLKRTIALQSHNNKRKRRGEDDGDASDKKAKATASV